MGYPRIIHFNGIFPYKPTRFEYPRLWKLAGHSKTSPGEKNPGAQWQCVSRLQQGSLAELLRTQQHLQYGGLNGGSRRFHAILWDIYIYIY